MKGRESCCTLTSMHSWPGASACETAQPPAAPPRHISILKFVSSPEPLHSTHAVPPPPPVALFAIPSKLVPGSAWNPGGQLLHRPVSSLNLPLLHSAQSTVGSFDPSPASHRVQLLAPVLARVLVTDPAGQSVHDKAEILSRYVPLGHGSQWVRFDSVPTTHGAQTPVAGSWT